MNEVSRPEDVRALYGEPSDLVQKKVLSRLDGHCQHFIRLSPFVVIASCDETGADATPRGDAPGFVAILDDRRLLIPDRRGNNRIDTLLNVARNPQVGLLFMVPGINETLRVNGRGSIVTDTALLEPLAAQGKVPTSGLQVAVEEAFFHCGKAMIRSRLWDPDSRVERKSFPTLGRIVADQIAGIDAEAADKNLEEGYRSRLY
ncbi:MAG: pyridoxamine 5'-phosphate oxidase family protein [Reyranellaceae bacterium]